MTVAVAPPPLCGPRLKSMPVPVKAIVLWVPLKLTVIRPFNSPAAVGAKATLIVQDAWPASEVPQLFVSVKPELGAMLVRLNAESAWFVIATACVALVVPTS